MADRQRNNYLITSNAGSIHNRANGPLLMGHHNVISSNNKTNNFMSKCSSIIKQDCQILLLSFMIIITFCGESIFRKSVSTIMYNYRWFILMLINILSFLLYLFIILYRKIKSYVISYQRKKRKQEKKQRRQQQQIGEHININSKDTQSNLSVLSSATSTDLLSNLSLPFGGDGNNNNNNKRKNNKNNDDDSINYYLNWRSYILISLLDCIHCIFIFIPIAILPANIVQCIPLIGLSIFSLFNCCISCDNTYIKLGYENMFGCLLLFISIFLLLFQDDSTSKYLTENDQNYDKKYISNLILFFIGCILLIFNDIYKRISLSKIRIDMIEFNLIQSILSIIILWLLSPLAFQIQYISKYNNEDSHITNITKSMINIRNGFKCLFGTNSYFDNVKDNCHQNGIYLPIIQFLILLSFMILNRLSLYQLLQKETYLKYIVNKNSFLQHLNSIAIIISFVFCYFVFIQNLWNKPTKNNGMYPINLKMDWETPIIIILLTLGSYLSFRKIDQRRISLKLLEDQWIIT